MSESISLREKNKSVLENTFTYDELHHWSGFYNMDGPVGGALTKDMMYIMADYVDFSKITTIFDIGSRDACQSLELNKWFPSAKLYTFEPVPSNIEWCLRNTVHIPNIEVIQAAASSYTGRTKFYEVVNGNVGASSLLKTTNHWWAANWQQQEIEADCIRIDEFAVSKNIDKIDIVWMDVQGSEKIVLAGFGKYLNDVDVIATEIGLVSLYENSILKNELDVILSNFTCISSIPTPAGVEADVIYVNNKLINK